MPLVIVAVGAPMAAFGITPGLYDLNTRFGTFEQICLSSDLSWHTNGGAVAVSGHWLTTKTNTNAFGTGSATVGNVSIVVNRPGTGANWTEWTSDLSYFNVVEPLTVTQVASTCS